MSVIFRADASSEIGAGHVMRCLALAECISLAGRKCYFLGHSRHYGDGLVKKILDAGHEIISLPDLDSATQDENADACIQALSGIDDVEYLIVDHYSLDYRWQGRMRACANKIMVIDDLADRRHDCDVLLDQSFLPGAEGRYDDLLPERCVKLLGPLFALLRREFWSGSRPAKRCRQDPADVPALLIMFGGADAHNLTARVVDVLISMKWQGAVDVVVGPLYACSEAFKSEVQRLPNARLHVSPNNIAHLMSSADLAVGSPGGSSWERCACALPSIVISQASNQEAIAVSLGEAGAHLYLGRSDDVECAAIASAIDVFVNNKIARDFMASNAARLCDGNGASRVVKRLFPSLLSVEKASLDDARLIYDWRNDPRVRQCSIDQTVLDFDRHVEWFRQKLSSSTSFFLIAKEEFGRPVACVRFDCAASSANISIYTDPGLTTRGYGSAALRAALVWLANEHPEITVTEADVLVNNQLSHRMFSGLGYLPQFTHYVRYQ